MTLHRFYLPRPNPSAATVRVEVAGRYARAERDKLVMGEGAAATNARAWLQRREEARRTFS